MQADQAVFTGRRRRPVRGRLRSVIALALAAVTALATIAPASAGVATARAPGLQVRVVGTQPVGASRFGAIVAVTGANGVLDTSAFRLWEDGRARAIDVQPLPASGLRISVFIAARSADQLQRAQNAATDLLIGLPNGALAAVVGGSPPRVMQPPTSDPGRTVQALSGTTPTRQQDDSAALTLAVRALGHCASGRRAVVVVATRPIATAAVQEVSGELRAANTSLSVVAIAAVPPALASLAGASGGLAATASTGQLLTPAVEAVTADLLHRYRLVFTSAHRAPTARLRVSVAQAGTTASTEVPVRVTPPPDGSGSAADAPGASADRSGGFSLALPIAGVLLLLLAVLAVLDLRRRRRAGRPVD